jgi:hypothetical protein
MRKICSIATFLFLFVFFGGIAKATTSRIEQFVTVSGIVVDQDTNQPIPWAYVQFHRVNPETGYLDFVVNASGPDGNFIFRLPEGEYLLEASAETYYITRLNVSLRFYSKIDLLIVLTPSPAIISEPSLVF